MKKTLLTVGITFLMVLSMNYFSTNAHASENDTFHEGEEPLETYVDEETGVVVEEYPISEGQKGKVTTFAGNGSWNFLGKEYWTINMKLTWYRDGVYKSTGGDYMFRVPPHSVKDQAGVEPGLTIRLYEEDIRYDDKVVQWKIHRAPTSGRDYVIRDINRFVDGTHAEFYTEHRATYVPWDYVHVEYFD